MKSILTFCLCVLLLPPTINGETKYQDVLDKIEAMMKENRTINGVFKPAEEGYIGEGSYGMIYKGTLVTIGKEVAMKFTKSADRYRAIAAAKEYAIYSYLNAVNNEIVERYGVPCVYFYGRWQGYILMALTLLDSRVKVSSKSHGISVLNVLIIFREFVRISKYIHSRGIFHNDIKLDNMMFRRNQGFIIDFNVAKKMNWHAQEDERQYAKEDWKLFFYAMCAVMQVKIDYFGVGNLNYIADNMEKLEGIISDALRRVFIEFAKNIYEGDLFGEKNKKNRKSSATILHYDDLNKTICEEIDKVNPSKPALVSWLKAEDKTKAIQELTELPKLISINDPFGMVEPQYSDVKFDYFYKKHEPKSPEIVYEMEEPPFSLGPNDLEFGLSSIKKGKRYEGSHSASKRKK